MILLKSVSFYADLTLNITYYKCCSDSGDVLSCNGHSQLYFTYTVLDEVWWSVL